MRGAGVAEVLPGFADRAVRTPPLGRGCPQGSIGGLGEGPALAPWRRRGAPIEQKFDVPVDLPTTPLYTHRSAAGPSRGFLILICLRTTTMKVRSSLKSLKGRHRDCKVVRRKGIVYVINKTDPRFKAKQG